MASDTEAALRAENDALRAQLRRLRPSGARLCPDAFVVRNTQISRSPLPSHAASPLPAPENELVDHTITLFSHRRQCPEYTHSDSFAKDLIELSKRTAAAFASEARLLRLSSPAYVFGDIHGNMADLHFFSSNIWRLGMAATAGTFLFLGDYVDRGPQGLECVAYLFSLKLACPDKMFMIRGNHELRKVRERAARGRVGGGGGRATE